MISTEDRRILAVLLVNSEDEGFIVQAGREMEKLWRVMYSSEALHKVDEEGKGHKWLCNFCCMHITPPKKKSTYMINFIKYTRFLMVGLEIA